MNPLYPEIVPIRLRGRVSPGSARNPHRQGGRVAVPPRRRLSYLLDQSNYSPNFFAAFARARARSPFLRLAADKIFFILEQIARRFVAGIYFYPSESLHGRARMKKRNFPGDRSQLCSPWLHFPERDAPRVPSRTVRETHVVPRPAATRFTPQRRKQLSVTSYSD